MTDAVLTGNGGAADRPPLVLVAEDATIVRLDLCRLLEAAGYEVIEARDGLEAVELARERKPDLALFDVKMPNLDGIEAARQILREQLLPIVMLTAYADDEFVSRAIDAGVSGYLVKPFREQDLLPAIKTAQARYKDFVGLLDDYDSLNDALSAQKTVERAKALLMEREGLTEGEAFVRLREASKLSGQGIDVVAGAVISALTPA